MNKSGKIIAIVIGLILLAVLVYFIAPIILNALNKDSGEPAASPVVTETSEEAQLFENFVADLNAAAQYSICATKTVTKQGEESIVEFGCTVRGDDYAVKIVADDQTYRQFYIGGEYTYADDTTEMIYENVQVVDFPDIHLMKATTGKIINTGEAIVDGNQLIYVEIYKEGIVYAFYLNQQGSLVSFYYIYDNNEVTIDFTSFELESDLCTELSIPTTYTKGIWDPSNTN